jgi:ABC-type glycerol-3-phosphate transport system permease component
MRMKKRNDTTVKVRRSRGDLVFDVCSDLLLGAISLIVLYPLYFVLIASISAPEAVNAGRVVLYPIGITPEGYQKLFEDSRIWLGYRNTLLYTLAGTTLDVCLTLITAYPLSFKQLPGRKFFVGIFMFTMFFNGGLIPTFLLVKSLNLYDTPFVLVLLGALNIYNMIIAKSFFEGTISRDLMDAAEIDGCGKLQSFGTIVLPLSKALIGVLVVYYGVAHWNQYFNALIYISKDALRPLQMVLREILIQNSTTMQVFDESMMLELLRRERYAELIKYGVIVVASVPVLCIYPFIQKYFTKGVMLGAVKE